VAADEDLIWIQSEMDERTRTGLAYDPSSDPYIAGLRVRVETDGFRCDRSVLVSENADGLAAYFADLVENWRGWDGVKQWEALEHGMSIEATHRGRVVELLFVVRRDYKPDAWEVRAPILIAPGETLTSYARAIARAFPDGLRAAHS
jgi:hypothetical protein